MLYIISILILSLLTVSVWMQSKEKERWFWVKVILVYLCYFFSFNISLVKIPVLIIVAYFIIRFKSKLNKKIKYQVLIYSFTLFITVNYVIPPLSLGDIYTLNKEVKYTDRFEKIDSIYRYTEYSYMQDNLKIFDDSPQIIFTTWVYNYRGIDIKDYEWLWRYSYKELDFNWMVHNDSERKMSEAYIRFNKTGEEYLGILKEDKNGEYYLELVIEGNLRQDVRTKSIF